MGLGTLVSSLLMFTKNIVCRCAGPMPSTFCPDILLEYHDCDGEFICDQLSSRDSRCVEIVGNKLDYTWQDSDTVVLRDVFKNRSVKH